ncbi:MAG TPA: lasso peptide biosynthesis B2 protein [Caulobacteraceae bacterium]|nr:lasso peptide biosynthesis B2 protein [Caulobacteraceae bacterium]
MTKLRRLAAFDPHRRGLLIEAAFWLLAAKLALLAVPFPQLARRIGKFVAPTDARVAERRQAASSSDAALAAQIGWATVRAARHVPFRAVCLPQAMAARIMLRRRGVASVLHFGAAKGRDKPIDAHAWLDAAGVEVTGYPVSDQFAEIACFV